MSAQRAPASAAAIAPGVSATLIASRRAEPCAYASTSLDRRSAVAVAEPRLATRVIHTIRMAASTAPSRIHSQRRLVPDPAAGAAALEAAVAAGAVVAGWLAVAVAAVALRLGRLLAALLIAPLTVLPAPAQPAAPTARQTATRIAAGRESLFAERRMSILPGHARRHGRGTREQWSAAAPCRGIIRGGVPCGEHR